MTVPPAANWHIRRYRRGDFLVLELHGEIDIAAVSEGLTQVDDATAGPAPRLVVDLTPVGFIDASGLRLLARAYRRCREQRGDLRVVCPHRFTRRVLRLGGFTGVLRIVGTLGEALAAENGGEGQDTCCGGTAS